MSLIFIYKTKDISNGINMMDRRYFSIGCVKSTEQESIKEDIRRRLNMLYVEYQIIERPNNIERLDLKGQTIRNEVNTYIMEEENKIKSEQDISIVFYYDGIKINGDIFKTMYISDTLNQNQRKALKSYLMDNVFMYIPYNKGEVI